MPDINNTPAAGDRGVVSKTSMINITKALLDKGIETAPAVSEMGSAIAGLSITLKNTVERYEDLPSEGDVNNLNIYRVSENETNYFWDKTVPTWVAVGGSGAELDNWDDNYFPILLLQYTSEPDGVYGFPATSTALPGPQEYSYGTQITPASYPTTEETTAEDPEQEGVIIQGTWSYNGWDLDSFIITNDTTLFGTWVFTPDNSE